MRNAGLRGVCRGRRKVRTTLSDRASDYPADLVERDFTASAPDRLWVADLTYIRTRAGWVYAAFIIDAYSKYIVGWQTATTLRAGLAIDALEMAVATRRLGNCEGLVHHSDRGSNPRSRGRRFCGKQRRQLRQRPSRDHHRPLQNRTDPQTRTLAKPRSHHLRHSRIHRLVQPPPPTPTDHPRQHLHHPRRTRNHLPSKPDKKTTNHPNNQLMVTRFRGVSSLGSVVCGLCSGSGVSRIRWGFAFPVRCGAGGGCGRSLGTRR